MAFFPIVRRRASVIRCAFAITLFSCSMSGTALAFARVDPSETGTEVKAGDQVVFGLFTVLESVVDDTIHLVSAELSNLPQGVRLSGVSAIRPAEYGSLIGVVRFDPDDPRFRPHPVTDVIVKPRTFSVWQIVFTLVADRPGSYLIRGVLLRYQIGSKRGAQYFPQSFRVDAIDCSVLQEPAVCSDRPAEHRDAPIPTMKPVPTRTG